ncbi:DUF1588 domain-containing protein [Pseudobacteriovorax antillogorgiicola]|uniref:Planctomycete cytochrome C n=1 Tax=Pseudobacteriovorax antillogorgiicola TaxID=1513793 RepID=A0A1Y6CF89_9BACT|nr:DUF1588 domain-containing protein [Pseudobacteriovorax antillogorgiicola]TCS47973.1 uncharacterized protein DUF1585 [Pseudobacteriovorax antillogorgiicola]SMF58237.1 Protein of unknown function [Pseudobacteriovorax antillogorgiicola]
MFRLLLSFIFITSCSLKPSPNEEPCDVAYDPNFEETIFPLVSDCGSCHEFGATGSATKFMDGSGAEDAFAGISKLIGDGKVEALRKKPTGLVSHGGGTLITSDDAGTWDQFLDGLSSQQTACLNASDIQDREDPLARSTPYDSSSSESCQTTFEKFDLVSGILENCVSCHGGSGQGALGFGVFEIGGNESSVYKKLLKFVDLKDNGIDLLQMKPVGGLSHSGGAVLSEKSTEYQAWLALTNELESPVLSCSKEVSEPIDEPFEIHARCDSFDPIEGGYKRLTAYEYRKTLAYLTAIPDFESITLADLPSDPKEKGFATISGIYTMTDSHLSVVFDNAELIADAMLSTTSALPNLCKSSNIGFCVEEFISNFGERAFRRALAEEERASLLSIYQNYDHQNGLKAIMISILVSPSFLYKSEIGHGENGTYELSDREIADQLSFMTLGHPAEGELLTAAASGKLRDPVYRVFYLKQLMASDGFALKGEEYVSSLLDVSSISTTGKDPLHYPSFQSLKPKFANEIKAFGRHLFSNDVALGDILASNYSFVDHELASFYDMNGDNFEKAIYPASSGRSGLVTQGAFSSVHGHVDSSAPILRGATLVKQVLCKNLPEPPNDIPPISAIDATGLTGREIVELHSSNEACASCHTMIDPLGFSLEGFDGIGAKRLIDNGSIVDTEVSMILDGTDLSFRDAKDMGSNLAKSKEFNFCMHEQALRFGLGVSPKHGENQCFLADIWSNKAETLSMQDILIKIVQSDYFITRRK